MSKQPSPSSPQSQQPPQSPPDIAPLEASIDAREQEQSNIDALQEQGDKRPHLTAREQELEDELAKLRGQLAEATKPAASAKPYPAYKPAKDEEHLTHVRIVRLGGEVLAEPVVKAFDSHQYRTSISKQAGFQAEVLHKGKAAK
ncbi:hypothetical protein [Hymenobacter guriensis]|uniref:Uncharacterized protein n=1 Tax=Hymenobacter guriensis TaxID=2793065 RepID=A0ABS0L9G1_9BACT|nr:hypothetical protein [Hymenobacter guriensis]MBG8556169.1 hypothetical protein [Hymenobacter guriensis]